MYKTLKNTIKKNLLQNGKKHLNESKCVSWYFEVPVPNELIKMKQSLMSNS